MKAALTVVLLIVLLVGAKRAWKQRSEVSALLAFVSTVYGHYPNGPDSLKAECLLREMTDEEAKAPNVLRSALKRLGVCRLDISLRDYPGAGKSGRLAVELRYQPTPDGWRHLQTKLLN